MLGWDDKRFLSSATSCFLWPDGLFLNTDGNVKSLNLVSSFSLNEELGLDSLLLASSFVGKGWDIIGTEQIVSQIIQGCVHNKLTLYLGDDL